MANQLFGTDAEIEAALSCRAPLREMIGEKFMQEFGI